MKLPYFLRAKELGRDESPWVHSARYSGFICQLTVTPDPQRYSYSLLSTENQVIYIKKAVSEMLYKYPKIQYIDGSFEFNKGGEIHLHCLLIIPDPYNPHFWAIRIGKYLHEMVGRKKLSWHIAARTDCIDSVEKWKKYLDKEPFCKWDGTKLAPLREYNGILDYIIAS